MPGTAFGQPRRQLCGAAQRASLLNFLAGVLASSGVFREDEVNPGASRIVEPMDPKWKWAFKTPQHDSLMADAIVKHMTRNGRKSFSVIAQSDAYGTGWIAELQRAATAQNIKVAAVERYNRADISVTSQILKLTSVNPDAIVIVAAGGPFACSRISPQGESVLPLIKIGVSNTVASKQTNSMRQRLR